MRKPCIIYISLIAVILLMTMLVSCNRISDDIDIPTNLRIEGTDIVWDEIYDANDYNIYSNGKKIATISDNKYDLMQITTGNVHNLSVRAMKDRWEGSDFSDAYCYVREGSEGLEFEKINGNEYQVSWHKIEDIKSDIYIPTFHEESLVTKIVNRWLSLSDKFFESENIHISGSIKEFGVGSIRNLVNVSYLNLPYCIEKIAGDSFNNVQSLGKINLSKDNPYFVIEDSIIYDKEMKTLIYYASGKEQKHFDIPMGISKIDECAFSYARFETINIPYSVVEIGEGAFIYSNLKEIHIPENVESLHDLVACENLEKVVIDANIDGLGFGFFAGCINLETIEINKDFSFIGWMAFMNCYSLEHFFISKTVNLIEMDAFKNCDNLIIYVEGESDGNDWHEDWSGNVNEIIYGISWEEYENIINHK